MALTRITKGVIKPNENYDTHNINSTGIVTAIGLDVNGNGDISGNLNVGGVLTYEDVTSIDSVGIITAQSDVHVGGGVSAVGVGTFGSLDIGGDIDVDGHTNLDNISVTGVSTFSDGKISFNEYGDISGRYFSLAEGDSTKYIDANIANGNQLSIRGYVGNNFHHMADFVRGGLVGLNYSGNRKLETSNTGITVTGTAVATGADINGDLDVDGHTNLDNVSIAGVSTFSDDVTLTTANGNNIYIDKSENSLKLGDSTYAKFGGAGELMMYHDGTYSVIKDTNSSPFNFEATGTITFAKAGLTETYAKMIPDGAVELYHNGTKRLETTSAGVVINGAAWLENNGSNLEANGLGINASIFHNGDTDTAMDFAASNDQINFRTAATVRATIQNTGLSVIGIMSASNANISGDLDVDGHTNLDNVSVAGVSTFSSNITLPNNISMFFGDGGTKIFGTAGGGASNGLRFFTDSGGSLFIDGNHNVYVQQGNLSVTGVINSTVAGGNNQLKIETTSSGDPSIYFAASGSGGHNIEYIRSSNTLNFKQAGGSVRLSITAAGHLLPGTDSQYNIGENGTRFANIYADTLYGDGSNLTGITQTTINNNADNRIITGSGTANTLEAEANLTWNGNTLTVSATIPQVTFNDTNNENDFGIKNINGNFQIVDLDESNRIGFQMGSDGNTMLGGNTTMGGKIFLHEKIEHIGDTDTYLQFDTNTINLHAGGTTGLTVLDASVRVPTKLGINGAAPQTPLDVIANGSGYAMAIRGRSSDNIAELRFTSNDYGSLYGTIIGGPTYLKFATGGTIRWQMDSSGHLLPNTAGAVNIGSATAEIGNVYIADSKILYLGSDQDLTISHNGTHGFIHAATGGLYMKVGNGEFLSRNGGEVIAKFLENTGGVELYHNNIKKLHIVEKGIEVTGEVAASQDYPNLRPSLDLNFAATKKLDSRITYTRSGTASFTNEHGLLEIVNSNVPRFDHDPVTRECKGLLIEEPRTNLLTYSNVAGMSSPNLGGNPQTNDSVDNITLPTGEKGTVRRYLANASGGGGRWGDYSGTNNTSYTGSVWIRTVSGTGSAILDINDGGSKTISLTTEWQRVTTTHSTNNTYRFFDIYFSSPTTIYYWGVQIEAGAFMTSYIPTYNATATRGGDRTFIPIDDGLDFYNPVESTILVDYTHQDGVTSSNLGTDARLYRFRATGGADTRIDYVSNTGYNPYIARDGSSPANLSHGQQTVFGGGLNRNAVRVKENSFAVSFNGSTVVEDTSGNWDPANAIDHVTLGGFNDSFSGQLSGHIQRFVYYPVGVSNSQLVTLTS